MAKKKAAKATAKKAATKKTTKKKAVKVEDGDDEAEAKVKKKKAKKKKAAKRPRKKAADARLKVYWGVFNHAMKRVALYEYNQRKAAEKRAKELVDSGKPPHFVAKIKEEIEEK